MVKKKHNHKQNKKQRYIKIFVAFFLIALFSLVLSYAALTYLTKDKALPKTTLLSVSLSSKSTQEIGKTIDSLNKTKGSQKIILEFEGKAVSKTYAELGLKIDSEKTTNKVISYGKKNNLFPTPSYILKTLGSDIKIQPELVWDSDSTTRIEELFSDKKLDPKPAKFTIDGKDIKIENEESGYTINTALLKNQIAQKYIQNSYPKVIGEKRVTSGDILAQELTYYKENIKTIVFSGIVFTNSYKNVTPKPEELLNFVDLERTILSQSVTLSDTAIKKYLDDVVAKKINVSSSTKQISSYDNSVISEGRQGIQLDSEKTASNISGAILAGNKTAQIVTSVTPIKEEVISPGFTPNKYPGKYIEVNLTKQMLYLMEGDKNIKSYKVSTGKWSMPTPEGEYVINNKDPRAYSQEYNLYMPFWMAFIGSQYGIHELPEWPDGRKEGEAHLGTPVSHGCVRLGRGSAEEVYNWTDIGTPVYIHK
jgi:lipoprotein-anchoring transpeptidase ErfK/SrfK